MSVKGLVVWGSELRNVILNGEALGEGDGGAARIGHHLRRCQTSVGRLVDGGMNVHYNVSHRRERSLARGFGDYMGHHVAGVH